MSNYDQLFLFLSLDASFQQSRTPIYYCAITVPFSLRFRTLAEPTLLSLSVLKCRAAFQEPLNFLVGFYAFSPPFFVACATPSFLQRNVLVPHHAMQLLTRRHRQTRACLISSSKGQGVATLAHDRSLFPSLVNTPIPP